MDPEFVVRSALLAVDEIINLVNHIKSQKSLSVEQIAAIAEAQDLQNKEDIKTLLAL